MSATEARIRSSGGCCANAPSADVILAAIRAHVPNQFCEERPVISSSGTVIARRDARRSTACRQIWLWYSRRPDGGFEGSGRHPASGGYMRHLLSHAAVAALMVALTGTAGLAQPPDTVRVRIGGSAQVGDRLVPTRAAMCHLDEATAPTAEATGNHNPDASSGGSAKLRRTRGGED